MLNEEKLNELCAKELLELDRHTYGYATAGKDINAVLDRYVVAYKSGYRAAERDAQELVEVLEWYANRVDMVPSLNSEYLSTRDRVSIATEAKLVLSKWRERGV